MINPFGLVSTIVSYKIFEKAKKLPVIGKIPPLLTSGIALIFILKNFGISYSEYCETASYLTFLLIPATVSLGYPLYKNFDLLKKNKRIIYPAFAIAVVCALLTTLIIGIACRTELKIILSMLPKSVTAPIATEISKRLNAVPELTVCIVALTGVFGGLAGHKILKLIKVKQDIAIGLAIGAASHVIGTSKCIETGRQKQIVMSTLSLITVGIITAVITPFIAFLIKFL